MELLLMSAKKLHESIEVIDRQQLKDIDIAVELLLSLLPFSCQFD